PSGVPLARAARRRGRAPACVQSRHRVLRCRAGSGRRPRHRDDRASVSSLLPTASGASPRRSPASAGESRGSHGRGIGVLVSGEGTNLQALLDAGLPVVGVAANRPDAGALERAEAAGVKTAIFTLDEYPGREARDGAMADWLEASGVEL